MAITVRRFDDKSLGRAGTTGSELRRGAGALQGHGNANWNLLSPNADQETISQILPMDGKRIKIYHRGIKRMCENCFGSGHYRSVCPRAKIAWMAYVDYFVVESGFEEGMFGKWIPRAHAWRIANEQAHQENLEFLTRKQAAEDARMETLAESATSIAKTMKKQQATTKAAKVKESMEPQRKEDKEKALELQSK